MIRAVQKEHAGIFQCFAHNPEGAVQGMAMVSVVPRTVTAVPGATHTRPGKGKSTIVVMGIYGAEMHSSLSQALFKRHRKIILLLASV